MMESSDMNWNIASPNIKFIKEKLRNYNFSNDTIILSMILNFERKVIYSIKIEFY